MSLMFFCEDIPEAKVSEDRLARLMELVKSEEPRYWEDEEHASPDDCRAVVARAVAYLAEVPNRETEPPSISPAQYAVLAAGGMTSSDMPSDACEQFHILRMHAPAVIAQIEQWAIEDRRSERQRRRCGDRRPYPAGKPGRVRTVTIAIHYASVEGQTETLGTVVVPAGVTDDDLRNLFFEWRDLASGKTVDPDDEEHEGYRWCEPGTDYQFLVCLVEKHGFCHAQGTGEELTLVW